MSMMTLVALSAWVAPAAAEGTAIWLQGTPDPTLDPALHHIAADTLLPETRWTEDDDRAIAFLRDELVAVQPLLDVFDGELQIMLRLETAIGNIEVLRAQDRELLYRALLFQGLAVRRYFQDGLATEAGAAPYRVTIGDHTEVRPWVDAVALDPDRQATVADIPEEPELLLFQEARARHLLTPSSQIRTADPLPEGGRLVINGTPATVDRMRVLPGMHRVTIEVDGEIRARQGGRPTEAEPLVIMQGASRADVPALVAQLSAGDEVVALSSAMRNSIADLAAPVHLVVDDGRRRYRYQIEGSSALRYEEQSDGTGTSGLGWRVAVGGGWIYDGDYLLQNASDGAPSTRGTVNAGAPVISAGLDWGLGEGRFVLGAGTDALLPLGAWHSLPSGEEGAVVRARLYPHLSAGLPWLRVTGGMMFPWHVGAGPRLHIPLQRDVGLELTGAWIYGLGLPLSYDSGETFTPARFQTGWLAVGVRR